MGHIVKVKSENDNKTYAALLAPGGVVKIFEDNFIKCSGIWDGQRIKECSEQLGPDPATSALIYKELEMGLQQAETD